MARTSTTATSIGIKAIETTYNGYRFRSRLEARYAVFFDKLGVEYEYEKEGFTLPVVGAYLPDFWLPKLNMWVEVKGTSPSQIELNKAKCLAFASKSHVFVVQGDDCANSVVEVFGFYNWPSPFEAAMRLFSCHGVEFHTYEDGQFDIDAPHAFIDNPIIAGFVASRGEAFYKEIGEYGLTHNLIHDAISNKDLANIAFGGTPNGSDGFVATKSDYIMRTASGLWPISQGINIVEGLSFSREDMEMATAVARSARFEHGEKGGVR